MLRGLFIYPNYLGDNPTSRQFDRFLQSIQGQCQLELLCLPGQLTGRKDSVSSLYVVNSYTRSVAYLGEFIKHHFSALASIPDELRWNANPLILKYAKRLIRDNNYDFIITLSYPLTCHLIGTTLKRRFGLPWLALFYDPWMDNPYRHHPSRFFEMMDSRLERRVASTADACVFTNQTMADIWQQKYSGSNSLTLPFCYSKEMMDGQEELTVKSTNKDEVRLLYVGTSNEQRNVQDLIQAVAELSREHCPGINRLNVSLGMFSDQTKHWLTRIGWKSSFHFPACTRRSS